MHLLSDVSDMIMPLTELTISRHNPLVDPTLHVWEWQIPIYLFLGGMVAGLMIIAGVRLIAMRPRQREALVCCTIGPLVGLACSKPGHVRAVSRSLAQALCLAPLYDLSNHLADVVGLVDSFAGLSGAGCQCARAPARGDSGSCQDDFRSW